MSNADKVATAWVMQEIAQMKAGNISFDGVQLKSYARVVGVRYPHFALVSSNYHSRTTQGHKAAATRAAAAHNLPVVMVPVVVIEGDRERAHATNLDRLRSDLTYAKQRHANYTTYEPYVMDMKAKELALTLYEEKFGLKQQEAADAMP